jgi:hypothetical protein
MKCFIKYKVPTNLICAILLSFICTSCIDRLDFIGKTEEGQLVIYGLLTDSGEKQIVTISRTSLLGLAPKGVPGAEVFLLTDSGEKIRYFNIGNGEYELINYEVTDKKRYSLEVIFENNIYRSSFESLPKATGEDNLSFTFKNEPFNNESFEPVFTIKTECSLPKTSEPIFIRWMVEETYLWERIWLPCVGLCPPPPPNCFISDLMEPNRLNLFDGSNTETRNTSLILGRRQVDNSFISIFYVSVRQLSINREAFIYWEKIKIAVSNQGSLFDIPPAPVFGNIYNTANPNERVLGYFEVAKEKITRISTNRGDVPFFLNRPCEFIVGKPASEYIAECIECDERARGKKWTTVEPPWWNEN